MHELSVTQSILDTVLRNAEAHGAARITSIRLSVGELNDLNREWIQRYFDYLSAGTVAEGATIAIARTPAGFTCHDCGTEFDVELSAVDSIRCPECDGRNCTLERGREFYIEDMEIEV